MVIKELLDQLNDLDPGTPVKMRPDITDELAEDKDIQILLEDGNVVIAEAE